ncbi:hypothetical protein BDW59DRAFT_159425 [Aspergillus cavernicola]|uniref:Uncharacterized protein n=1 Tax=Aspergillus cavernicola TaxID=176166 RepID=A0ABR4IMN0_9EURO
MLRGESWKTLMKTVPGFEQFNFRAKFLYRGLRDQLDVQRQRVIDVRMHLIWGSAGGNKVDFVSELKKKLEEKTFSPALVQLDLDILDDSYGKVNDYLPPGGLFKDVLVSCMDLVPKMATPKSLTVCSFDPDAGDGDKVARIVVWGGQYPLV